MFRPLHVLAGSFALSAILNSSVLAQEVMPGHEHHAPASTSSEPLAIGHTRDGSGTSWLPDDSPHDALAKTFGSWTSMAHFNAFAQWIGADGPRGADQAGSINWLMLMARRDLAGGRISGRVMVSAEPMTVGACGYPDLAQSGETCHGEPLRDRQHPHDLFMEVAAEYRRALADNLAFQAYGGLAGDPALGPVAYPHRPSAMPNLFAGISHHWLDSTHITFGVVTAGVYTRQWKVEGSAFNGREPDEDRYDLDLAALDSYSGRLWWAPSSRWSLQVSAGRLQGDGADGHVAEEVRTTASATYHRREGNRARMGTLAWGMTNGDGVSSQALLGEWAVEHDAQNTIFGRVEFVEKSGEELGVAEQHDAVARVAKLQGGYSRFLVQKKGVALSLGGSLAAVIVPATVASAYGGRASAEAAVFIRLASRASTTEVR